ncbi:hypothetical protein [Sphingobacterium tabacisoli]|uniref:Uncharacterized protein n=1 Tax=Sphingobacterium tabacisoli TaxID=2044855 RepID=A0ABW5L729_9SPHI|nr:hypothetical protein [Sphingobacterium tabacisoli]
MRKRINTLPLLLNASQGEYMPTELVDLYHLFVLVGGDLDLLDRVAMRLENEGKEVYFLEDTLDTTKGLHRYGILYMEEPLLLINVH